MIKSFHPLALLYMFATLLYGIGFLVLPYSDVLGTSSLFVTMSGIDHLTVLFWGIACIVSVVVTLAGYRLASLLGWSAWVFATICYAIDGNWLVLLAVALPNMLFWLWQYAHLDKLP